MLKTVLKRTAIGLGVVVAVAHIGALGHLIQRDSNESEFVTIPLPPVNEYSSYRITATRDGYSIEYIGNDPRVMTDDAVDERDEDRCCPVHCFGDDCKVLAQDAALSGHGCCDTVHGTRNREQYQACHPQQE